MNTDGNTIELSMRIIAARNLRIERLSELDRRRLLDLQAKDGGWPVSWLCRTGKAGIRIGSRGVATALAVSAISN